MSTGYIPPFTTLNEGIARSADGETVTMSKELFSLLIAGLADAAGFDAGWYRAEYPDVASAVGRGDVTNELEHFAFFGYEEGRAHRMMPVDEAWYRTNYPDIDAALQESDLMTAYEHYNQFGYWEGRVGTPTAEMEAQSWSDAIERSAEAVRERESALD